jgi:integrase
LQVAEQNRQDFAIVMLFLQTGLGVSELVDLRLGDVSLETKELTVRQGKGRKDQVVPLVGQALEALKGEY